MAQFSEIHLLQQNNNPPIFYNYFWNHMKNYNQLQMLTFCMASIDFKTLIGNNTIGGVAMLKIASVSSLRSWLNKAPKNILKLTLNQPN